MAEMNLTEAGLRYAEARRAHSEAFLRYYNTQSKKTRTVAEAQAMADVDVDLVGAEVAWRIALEGTERNRLDLLFELTKTALTGVA